ncbi:PREDICTED: CMRF35-like molecule 7 [Chrysochloris asiatica]|uniref:CMRF35-like molecule 7 n=1 Tax=Chrysochloris asiatica TaxID=185453 RepID=A0A9B0TZW7_CHRAS|nr:PREDICTED: CMRF35-like molecule 7 [Chrysochloris asiatica]
MWLPPTLLFFSLPGCFSIQGPGSVSGPEQGSLTVQCHYKAKWETYKKWWCQGKVWEFCQILIQSTGSEQEVKEGRISIRDNHKDHIFMVTMDKLSSDDTDTYWCGIQKPGIDLGFQVKVTVVSEKSPLTSPSNLSSNPLVISSTSYIRTHYLLLVFVKVPILLILLGAVLWLKGPQRVPEEQWDMTEYAELSLDHMAKDTAL